MKNPYGSVHIVCYKFKIKDFTSILPVFQSSTLSVKVPSLMKNIFLRMGRNGSFISAGKREYGQLIIHNIREAAE